LRACAETHDSDFLRGLCGIVRAIRSLDAVSDDPFSVSLNSAAAGSPSRRASRSAGASATRCLSWRASRPSRRGLLPTNGAEARGATRRAVGE
jgi:hypothetical protein